MFVRSHYLSVIKTKAMLSLTVSLHCRIPRSTCNELCSEIQCIYIYKKRVKFTTHINIQ